MLFNHSLSDDLQVWPSACCDGAHVSGFHGRLTFIVASTYRSIGRWNKLAQHMRSPQTLVGTPRCRLPAQHKAVPLAGCSAHVSLRCFTDSDTGRLTCDRASPSTPCWPSASVLCLRTEASCHVMAYRNKHVCNGKNKARARVSVRPQLAAVCPDMAMVLVVSLRSLVRNLVRAPYTGPCMLGKALTEIVVLLLCRYRSLGIATVDNRPDAPQKRGQKAERKFQRQRLRAQVGTVDNNSRRQQQGTGPLQR